MDAQNLGGIALGGVGAGAYAGGRALARPILAAGLDSHIPTGNFLVGGGDEPVGKPTDVVDDYNRFMAAGREADHARSVGETRYSAALRPSRMLKAAGLTAAVAGVALLVWNIADGKR